MTIPDPFQPTGSPTTLAESLAWAEQIYTDNERFRVQMLAPPTDDEKETWRKFFEQAITAEVLYDMMWNAFCNPFVRLAVPFRVDPVDYRMFQLFSRLGYSMFENPFLPRRPKQITYDPSVT